MRATQFEPIAGKINFRLIVFLAVITAPIIWIAAQFVSAKVSHGIKQEGDVSLVDLKSLGNFPFDERTSTINDIPSRWRGLDGKKVALEGFMFPTNSAVSGVSGFQFVYNIQKCCFGGPPLVQERVFTVVPKGAVPYASEEVRCTGILHVGVHKNDWGNTSTVYTMDLERVDPI
jgi:hypothetical protein